MRQHAWLAFACVGGLMLVCFTAFAFSPGGFPFAARTAITAATLASDPNDPPDPNDPNDLTGIMGRVGYPDPNDPNHDPNNPWSIPGLGGVIVHAVQNDTIVGSCITPEPNEPNEGFYWVARMQPGTYDLRVIPPGYAAKVITNINVSSGLPTPVNVFDLVPEGRITGRVTDAAEQPLEPNKVHVWVDCGDGITRMVRPDANGDYVIGNLSAGTYTVNAYSRLATFEPQLDVQVVADANTPDIDFVAVAEGSISGRVTDSLGEPLGPNEITVMVDCGSEVVRGTEPNADGYYLLTNVPEGNYVVTASSVSYSLPPAPNVVVVTGQETPGVNFQAAAAGQIAGSVFASDGVTPMVGALVTAEPTPEGRDLSVAATDSNGYYILRNVPPGQNYTVKATHGSDPNDPNTVQPVGQAAGVSVTAGQTRAPVNVTAPGGAISGSLSSAVAGAIVTAVNTSTGFFSSAVPDVNGAYAISRLPAGIYDVSLSAPGYFAPRLSAIQVTQGQTTGHNFTLTVEGVISGQVTNGSASPIVGAVVSALDTEMDPNWCATPAVTDLNGNYVLGHLAAGSYTVFVEAEGFAGDSTVGVSVSAGQTTPNINFTLSPSGGSITGTVYAADGVTPIPGAVLTCYAPGLTLGIAVSGAGGFYELPLLKAGTYEVTATAEGHQTDFVSGVVVPADGTTPGVDFQLQPPS